MRFTDFFNLFLIFQITACATSDLKVFSEPEGADVTYVIPGEVPVKTGVTPTQIDYSGLKVKGTPIQIFVSKKGFKKESVLVPVSSMSQEAKVHFFLTEEGGNGQRNLDNLDEALEEVAKGVARIQELIRNRELDQSLSHTSTLIVKYPNIATLHGLQGNIFYLQKNIDKALNSYRKSEAISPSNETQKIINKLEQIKGGGNQ